MIRFRDCPRCGGDMIVQYGEDGCLQCGFENVDVSVAVVSEEHDGLWRGTTSMSIEVIGVGVQRMADRGVGVNTLGRSRYYDANRMQMERDYAKVCRARDRDHTWQGRVRASRLYAEFLKYWGIRRCRWTRLQTRWHRQVATA